jgi:ankyrin repeat protein
MGRKKQHSISIVAVVDNTVSDKIIAKDYAGIRDLIAQGKDLSNKNSEGKLPLEVALLNGDFDAAIILIEGGANVNSTSKLGLTFLHIIVRQIAEYVKLGRSQEEILSLVERLVKKGANLSLQERRGNTVINAIAQLAKANKPHTAIYTKLAKSLLSLDKNVSTTIQIKNNMGKSPMDYLARNGNTLLRDAMYEKLPAVQNKITEELKQRDIEIRKLIALDNKELIR